MRSLCQSERFPGKPKLKVIGSHEDHDSVKAQRKSACRAEWGKYQKREKNVDSERYTV